MSEWDWLFNVTINDISVIYVTAHRCAGGLKKLDLRSDSRVSLSWVNWCFTSHATIFQSYIYDGTDVQADWRRSCCTYGLAPNAIDISQGSLTCPYRAYTDIGTTLFILWLRHTAPFSRLLRHAGDTEDVFSSGTPASSGGKTVGLPTP